jgi:anti-anti-sigma regulatory factor
MFELPSILTTEVCGKDVDVGIAVIQDADLKTVRLEGAIDIGCAAELKQALLEALAEGKELHVALDGATDLDVTAMQLMWAARRAAQKPGAQSGIVDGMPAPIATALADAGIDLF